MKKFIVYANISIPILAGSLFYYVTSPQVIFVQNIDRLLGVSLHVGMENTFVVNLKISERSNENGIYREA